LVQWTPFVSDNNSKVFPGISDLEIKLGIRERGKALHIPYTAPRFFLCIPELILKMCTKNHKKLPYVVEKIQAQCPVWGKKFAQKFHDSHAGGAQGAPHRSHGVVCTRSPPESRANPALQFHAASRMMFRVRQRNIEEHVKMAEVQVQRA
jgi:hypothetical protein